MDDLRFNVATYYDVGPLGFACYHCKALGFVDERKIKSGRGYFGQLCCNQGAVKFSAFPDLPPRLAQLWTGDDAHAKYFRKNARRFNASMSLASLTVNDATANRGGPGCFKIHGQLHRRIGPLLADPQCTEPSCIQTFIRP
ncbi:hypothetical protein ACHAWF_007019 [Thalassiosira exigua]